MWWLDTNVSEDCATSIFRVEGSTVLQNVIIQPPPTTQKKKLHRHENYKSHINMKFLYHVLSPAVLNIDIFIDLFCILPSM
jgi:hypothetical protein